MAMDLVARLRLIDNMTAPLKRMMASLRQMDTATKRLSESTAAFKDATTMVGQSVTKLDGSIRKVDRAMEVYRDTQGRLRDSTGRFVAENKRAENSLKSLASAARSTRLAIPVIGTIGGLAAGYGVAKGAESFLTSALGGAARMETDKVTLEALVNDAKKANQLFDMLNRKGLASTLSESDYLNMGKAYLPLTKNLKQIDKLTDISERLALSNLQQGAEGAAFAVREALSGDLVSLQERFNVPKYMLKNAFKGADTLTEKIAALDKVLNEMGYTQKFVTRVNQTANAQWDMLKSNVSAALAKMGTGALEKLKPVLVDINKWLAGPGFKAFTERGAKLLADGFDGVLNAAKTAWSYLDTHFFNNPAFQKLPTIESKVAFVIDDFTRTFSTWYDSTGSEQLKKATMRVTDTILDGLETAGPEIGKSAVSIGARIASGMIDGFFESMRQSKLGTVILQMPVFNAMDSSFQVRDKVLAAINGSVIVEDKMQNPTKMLDAVNRSRRATIPATPVIYGPPAPPKIDGSHYNGLEYVPYDGYTARLHKGERVLTAAENREYSGGGGITLNLAKLADHIVVREEADIDRIAVRLAREIMAAAH